MSAEISTRTGHAFQDALEARVGEMSWNLLQPLKVLKLGLHWVALYRAYPESPVKYHVFDSWKNAIEYAIRIADALRRPLALRYARPV
jgi:hypothetical protein